MARPTIYTQELVEKTRQYLQERIDEIEEYHKTRGEKSDSYERLVHVKLPTIEGLARYVGVNRDTLYSWAETYPEFSDILEEIRTEQADRLINGSLSGFYNPLISKLMLSKHGYIDKQDIVSDGKQLGAVLVKFIDGKDDRNTEGVQTPV